MEIKNSPTGRVIHSQSGYNAFIPNPLPPIIEWNNSLVSNLSRADHLLGMLAREGAKLPNPHLLMRPFITKEAVLSSKIEGTQATLGEVLAKEAGIKVDDHADDLKEIHNYIQALNYGLNRLTNFPLSLRVIKEIHAELMQGVRGSYATPGEFRRSQNWIGIPGCTLNTAKYVPPTPDELMECLGSFEKFLHNKTLPPLIHIALCHYQFEAIHPFLDGNGRIGRLLITLLLIERKLLPSPLLYLSAFFEATRDDYYNHLFNVSKTGAWLNWFNYFLNGVAIQSSDVLSRAERINHLITEWKLQVGQLSHGAAQNLIDYLTVNPFFTTSKIAEKLNVAYTTALRMIEKFEQLNIIESVSEKKRDRVYCATKILDILEEPINLTGHFEPLP